MKIKLLLPGILAIITIAFSNSYAMGHSRNKTDKHSANSAFIAKQDNKIIKAIGKYEDRHSPYSTFKVALVLMGFDSGILENKDSPKWSFEEKYEKKFQPWYTQEKGIEYNWRQEQTPATYMKDSVVWFSHQIIERLGAKQFQAYVSKLKYGNMDISGTPGKNDGLIGSWLGSSLQISPLEQVELLEKMLNHELVLSKDAEEKTMEIMERAEEWEGWKLYGKTGGGNGKSGWFIGWIEKDEKRIIFAAYLDLEDPELDLSGITIQETMGLTAQEFAKREIISYLQ